MTVPKITNVYVHAPFCARRCCYCDFAVDVNRKPDGARWLASIRKEYDTLQASGDAPLAGSIDTLYVGGGTPSVLEPRFIAGLPGVIGRERMATPELEWTVEANPESFMGSTARQWAAAGVNRVSLGVQSFDRRALKWMGRLHSAGHVGAAVQQARAAGIANLSVDLIFGLPDTISRCWADDLTRALELNVPHISLYGLTVEKGTLLHRAVGEGRAPMPAEGRYRDEYLLAVETLVAEGYEHYEVSNFSRPGFNSRHNRACWECAPYLGLGNGAHSYHAGRRWWNVRDWSEYAAQVARTGSGRVAIEVLNEEQSRLEALWLGLRTAAGVDTTVLGDSAAPVLSSWEARGLASRTNGRTRLAAEGWLILDDLTVELDQVLSG